MRKLIFVFLHVCFAICFCAVSIFAQNSVGYVLEIEGNWFLNGSNALSQGEKLPAGGFIRPNATSRFNRIVIADLRGDVIISRNCVVDNCSRSFSLPTQPPPSSVWNVAFDTVMRLISASPGKYSAHRSRTGEASESDTKLSDGILKLSGKTVDFSTVLDIRGESYLRWKILSDDEKRPRSWSQPTKLESTLIAPASSFEPGLYSFELLRRTGDYYERISSAWILISNDANYEKNNSAFQEAKTLSEKWAETVKFETVRSFLQAKLDDLARRQ